MIRPCGKDWNILEHLSLLFYCWVISQGKQPPFLSRGSFSVSFEGQRKMDVLNKTCYWFFDMKWCLRCSYAWTSFLHEKSCDYEKDGPVGNGFTEVTAPPLHPFLFRVTQDCLFYGKQSLQKEISPFWRCSFPSLKKSWICSIRNHQNYIFPVFFLAVWLERSHSPHPPERFWASAMAVPALRRGVFHTKMTGVTRSNFVRGITVEAMRLNTPLKESDVWHSWLVMVGEEWGIFNEVLWDESCSFPLGFVFSKWAGHSSHQVDGVKQLNFL